MCIVRGLYVQELASMCINLIAKILNPVHPQSPKLFMLPDEEQDNGHDRLPPCPRMMGLGESCHWGSGRTRQCDQPVCARSGSAVPRVGLHDIAPCLPIQYQWSTFRKLIISTTYYSFFFSSREGRGKETEEGRWKGIKKIPWFLFSLPSRFYRIRFSPTLLLPLICFHFSFPFPSSSCRDIPALPQQQLAPIPPLPSIVTTLQRETSIMFSFTFL